MTAGGRDRRWLAFTLLCAAALMIILDTTIVNVALPSIKADLGFDDATIAWVVNAYVLTFAGFLLLGGRVGDLFGEKRTFLAGLALFTGASLACGLAQSQVALIAARAVQGVGGAVMSAVSLAIVMTMFQEQGERARAMGFYSFIAAGGGSLGVLLGGVLTDALSWQWNFLINIPIGIVALAVSARLLPADTAKRARRLDASGATLVTLALVLLTFGIINSAQAGWASAQTIGTLGVALALGVAFVVVESRVRDPLVPLGIFRIRGLSVASVVGVLWAGAMFAWFFVSGLYMQLVLGYTPLQVGLAFLAPNLVMGVFAMGLSYKLVMRFGLRAPIAVGLGVAAVGLLLLGFAPEDGAYAAHVLPGMLLLGVGAGMATNPVILAAMRDVPPSSAGLASGVVNTAFMTGGAVGVASLATLAAARAASAVLAGDALPAALTKGYHAAFLASAAVAGLAAVIAATALQPGKDAAAGPMEAPTP